MSPPLTSGSALLAPFVEFAFMRRALVASAALAAGGAPLGCFLVLRRMSLVGDAMAHALLPGAALGFVIAGFSVMAMSLGGFVAALVVALLANAVTRHTGQREDASFAAFYLIALALGVFLLSMRGTSVDLMHVLFGTILAVDDASLMLIVSIACVSLLMLAAIYRPLVVDSFDTRYLKAVGGRADTVQALLLVLVVANLVTGFQALGTLMAVGLMMLPAAAARFWTDELATMIVVAVAIALLSGVAGLLLSFHGQWPSGPAIVLVAGAAYAVSVIAGRRDGLLGRRRTGPVVERGR